MFKEVGVLKVQDTHVQHKLEHLFKLLADVKELGYAVLFEKSSHLGQPLYTWQIRLKGWSIIDSYYTHRFLSGLEMGVYTCLYHVDLKAGMTAEQLEAKHNCIPMWHDLIINRIAEWENS